MFISLSHLGCTLFLIFETTHLLGQTERPVALRPQHGRLPSRVRVFMLVFLKDWLVLRAVLCTAADAAQTGGYNRRLLDYSSCMREIIDNFYLFLKVLCHKFGDYSQTCDRFLAIAHLFVIVCPICCLFSECFPHDQESDSRVGGKIEIWIVLKQEWITLRYKCLDLKMPCQNWWITDTDLYFIPV